MASPTCRPSLPYHRTTETDIITSTKALQSLIKSSHFDQALSLFRRILSLYKPDPFCLPLALKACANLPSPLTGRALHALALKSALRPNPFVACALLDFYAKSSSSPLSALSVFDEIPNPNLVTYNALLSCHVRLGRVDDALDLFRCMHVKHNTSSYNTIIAGMSRAGRHAHALEFVRQMCTAGERPNLITLLNVLPACASLAAPHTVREAHAYAARASLYWNAQLGSALVEAYGRCGCLHYARQVFDSMPVRDVVAWSALISAHALHGEAKNALLIFDQMVKDGVRPDGLALLAVLKACSHGGLVDEALRFVREMEVMYGLEVGVEHGACVVDVLGRAGRLGEAVEVAKVMGEGAGAKVWGAVLAACRVHGEVGVAEEAWGKLRELEGWNAGNYVLMASVYAGAGRHEDAERVRGDMREKGVRSFPGCSWVEEVSG
ncbi:hypothetical protein AMTRI_Chr03g46000 [Amborella trichopoda]